MKKLKSYSTNFNKNDIIIDKIYLLNYKIESENYLLIMIIIYNEYIFQQITVFVKFRPEFKIFFYILTSKNKIL